MNDDKSNDSTCVNQGGGHIDGHKLKVATIGSGYFSHFHHDAWQRLPDAELVALCTLADDGSDFARQYGIHAVYRDAQEMLETEQPDLVDIVTTPDAHAELIQLSFAHNAHVICQKPFCGAIDRAREMAALAKRSNRVLVVHENFRFQPWFSAMRRFIATGIAGKVFQFNFRLRPGDGQGEAAYLERQPYFRQMERFLVHETAIHFVDVFRYLMGEPNAVFADLRQLNPVIRGEDAGLFILKGAGDVRAVFDGNRLVDHDADNCRLTMGEMTVDATNGTLSLNGQAELTYRPHGTRHHHPVLYDWSEQGFAGDSLYRLQRHVLNHLIRGTPVMNQADVYLNNLSIEEAIYESSQSGAYVSIPTT